MIMLTVQLLFCINVQIFIAENSLKVITPLESLCFCVNKPITFDCKSLHISCVFGQDTRYGSAIHSHHHQGHFLEQTSLCGGEEASVVMPYFKKFLAISLH